MSTTMEVRRDPARVQAHPEVTLHAWGLQYPTHMEWSLDGRLLVSEREAGRITDVTDGGDVREKPRVFAEGLGRPAAILPLAHDTVLVADTQRGEVVNAAGGGHRNRMPVFADGLQAPYSLNALPDDVGEHRIFVSENRSDRLGQLTDITGGGSATQFRAQVSGVPYPPQGASPGQAADPNGAWTGITMGCENGPWTDQFALDGRYSLILEANYVILHVPETPATFHELMADPNAVLATGLGMTGGMRQRTSDDCVYVVDPPAGAVRVIDPRRPGDYRFVPPVVWGLRWPSCVRFSPDQETMYVCSFGLGVIWQVAGV